MPNPKLTTWALARLAAIGRSLDERDWEDKTMRIIESEMRDLKHKVLDMAELVLYQFEEVTLALNQLDYDLARKVRLQEKRIDLFDVNIDESCERIIALYQPLAGDLRFVFSVLKINAYLEQVGDLISGIARKLLEVRHNFDPEFLAQLELARLIEQTRVILSEALAAFFRENPELARGLSSRDDLIDRIHRDSFDIIIRYIQRQPDKASEYMQLYLIIKSFEKIADFAVGIAHEAIFHVEGEVTRHNDLNAYYEQLDERNRHQSAS